MANLLIICIIVFIIVYKNNTRIPKMNKINQEDCKPHEWVPDIKNELYCLKCGKRPG